MIRNIVFDFGGVLLDLDFQRTFDELTTLLGVSEEWFTTNDDAQELLKDWECGRIHKEHFLWNLQHYAVGEKPQPLQIIRAWNAMLLGWNIRKFEVLSELKNSYHLYLLSNTNQIHIDWVYRDLKRIGKYDLFHSIFDKGIFYSHDLKSRKPDSDIFEKMIDLAGLTPQKTIFIDDTVKNFTEAKKMGFNCLHHKTNESIDYLLKGDYGNFDFY